MKVNGQLEVAQLEQIAGNPALAPTGRIFIDITAPSAGVFKYFDGTSWQTVQKLTTTTVRSQNGGKACTVDWSTGLVQEVVLTDHCVISFTNPQSGQLHRLIVTQKTYASATPKAAYRFVLNLTDQDPVRGAYQPQGVVPPNENLVYNWYYSLGIRTGYANLPAPLATPSNTIGALASGIDMLPDRRGVTYGRAASPFLANHQFFDSGQRAGLLATNPGGAPSAAAAQIIGVRYSPYQDVLFVVSGTSPFIQSYSVINGFGSAPALFGNPGTLPTGAGQCIDVHPAGNHVIVGHTTSPFMSAYPFDDAGFGSKIANPGTLPSGQVNAVAFAPTGDFVAAANITGAPFLQVWPFDPVTSAFGSVLSNPATQPVTGTTTNLGKCLAWRPQCDYIAMCDGTNLYVTGFNRAGGAFTGTQLTVALGATATCVQWTPDGQYIIVGMSGGTFIKVYDFSSANLSIPVTLDGSNPGATVNDMVVDPSGRFVVLALNASPWIMTYPLPTKTRNYLRV